MMTLFDRLRRTSRSTWIFIGCAVLIVGVFFSVVGGGSDPSVQAGKGPDPLHVASPPGSTPKSSGPAAGQPSRTGASVAVGTPSPSADTDNDSPDVLESDDEKDDLPESDDQDDASDEDQEEDDPSPASPAAGGPGGPDPTRPIDEEDESEDDASAEEKAADDEDDEPLPATSADAEDESELDASDEEKEADKDDSATPASGQGSEDEEQEEDEGPAAPSGAGSDGALEDAEDTEEDGEESDGDEADPTPSAPAKAPSVATSTSAAAPVDDEEEEDEEEEDSESPTAPKPPATSTTAAASVADVDPEEEDEDENEEESKPVPAPTPAATSNQPVADEAPWPWEKPHEKAAGIVGLSGQATKPPADSSQPPQPPTGPPPKPVLKPAPPPPESSWTWEQEHPPAAGIVGLPPKEKPASPSAPPAPPATVNPAPANVSKDEPHLSAGGNTDPTAAGTKKTLIPADDAAAEEMLRVQPIPVKCERMVNASLSNTWQNDTYVSDLSARPPAPSRGKSLTMAMCLSGGLRTFRLIKDIIHETMVRPNDADVFMHVTVDAANQTDAISLLQSLPWVKGFVIDVHSGKYLRDWDTWKDSCGIDLAITYNKHLPMFRKIHMCDKLAREYEARHGVRYKTFVRSRPDLLMTDKRVVNFSTCPSDTVCLHQRRRIPHEWQFSDSEPNCETKYANYTAGCPTCCEMCSDFFAFGDSDIMHTYASVVHKIGGFVPVIGTKYGHREVMILWALKLLGVGDKVLESKNILKNHQPWLVRETDNINDRPPF
eukprot:TRINITY_DN3771_c0_g1_i1.p1 TRINITY_DN3771_c0_g1~~TRINITY_DN3771_c0_g1_i1.p1  ORF type:complete len:775 (-),score=250.36 TRINITY_DN3771_c0_g1_i1:451-2775(-)